MKFLKKNIMTAAFTLFLKNCYKSTKINNIRHNICFDTPVPELLLILGTAQKIRPHIYYKNKRLTKCKRKFLDTRKFGLKARSI